jgi:orotidine-5'-phosphate decarboxylase
MVQFKETRNRLIFALDYFTLADAYAGVNLVYDYFKTIKIGLQLYTRYGPATLDIGKDFGLDIFLDLKG